MGGWDSISPGNLDGGEDPIPTESTMCDPISAGNLDVGGSHICRKPRCREIQYLQET